MRTKEAETKEEALAIVGEILDRLGPGMSLHVDDRWVAKMFDLDRSKPKAGQAIDAAQDFAKRHGCGFQFESETGTGVFFRAYSERDRTA